MYKLGAQRYTYTKQDCQGSKLYKFLKFATKPIFRSTNRLCNQSTSFLAPVSALPSAQLDRAPSPRPPAAYYCRGDRVGYPFHGGSDCACGEYYRARTVKPHPFTELRSAVARVWLRETTINFESVCLGGSTERSCTHANWYTKVRHYSESLTQIQCWQKFMWRERMLSTQ